MIDLGWGYALLQRDFPLSEYHNRIVVESAAPAAAVLAAAEEVLGGAGLRHRYVAADDAVGQPLRDALVADGYGDEVVVTMVHAGGAVAAPDHEVRAVSLEEVGPAMARDWRVVLPDASDERIRQLVDRTALYERGAEVTRLAVFDADDIAANAVLFVDPVDHVAQFENLVTHADYRGRGFATALVRDALHRSVATGCDLCFLTADLADWPRQWYGRLGYVEVGRTHHFSRR